MINKQLIILPVTFAMIVVLTACTPEEATTPSAWEPNIVYKERPKGDDPVTKKKEETTESAKNSKTSSKNEKQTDVTKTSTSASHSASSSGKTSQTTKPSRDTLPPSEDNFQVNGRPISQTDQQKVSQELKNNNIDTSLFTDEDLAIIYKRSIEQNKSIIDTYKSSK